MTSTFYTDEELLFKPDLLQDKDGNVVVRDPNIYIKGMEDISYTHWEGTNGVERIKNYYHLIYLPKVLMMLEKGAKRKKIIYLDERQILNVNRAYHILIRTGRYLDISPAGSGKSLIAMVLSIMLDTKGVKVFGIKAIENTWVNMAEREYEGVKIRFSRLGMILGNVNNLPNGYLVGWRDDTKKKMKVDLAYKAGSKFKKLIKKGWFIMFDESHQGKNKSNASRGYHAMTCYHCSTFGTSENNSYIMFSSASPSDKDDITPIYYSMCIVNKEKLVVEGRGIQVKNRTALEDFYEYTGDINKAGNKAAFSDVFKTNKKYGSVKLNDVSDSQLSDAKVNAYLRKTLEYVYRSIFISYTSNVNSNIIKNNIDAKYRPDVYYHLYKLNYGKGFDEYLSIFSDYIRKVMLYNSGGNLLTIYGKVITSLSFIIIPVIIDQVVDILVKDPMRKIIIYSTVVEMTMSGAGNLRVLFYMKEAIEKGIKARREEMIQNKIDTANRIKALNKADGGNRHYETDITGKEGIEVVHRNLNETERFDIIKLFQKNNSKIRLLITTPGVLGTGESLDDQYGDYRRTIIAVSNFRGDITRQLMKRVQRRETKSRAEIIFPIAIGNDLIIPGVKDRAIYDSLEDFKMAANIKDIPLLDLGKVPSGNLNYAIATVLNRKAHNMDIVDADDVIDKMYEIKFIYDRKPIYPISGQVDKIFLKYMKSVEETYKNMEPENIVDKAIKRRYSSTHSDEEERLNIPRSVSTEMIRRKTKNN